MDALGRIRDRAGWTRAELAAALDCTRQLIYQYERGETTPRPEMAHRIIDLGREHGLHLSLDDIYPRERR